MGVTVIALHLMIEEAGLPLFLPLLEKKGHGETRASQASPWCEGSYRAVGRR
jgi:hypothetical protein